MWYSHYSVLKKLPIAEEFLIYKEGLSRITLQCLKFKLSHVIYFVLKNTQCFQCKLSIETLHPCLEEASTEGCGHVYLIVSLLHSSTLWLFNAVFYQCKKILACWQRQLSLYSCDAQQEILIIVGLLFINFYYKWLLVRVKVLAVAMQSTVPVLRREWADIFIASFQEGTYRDLRLFTCTDSTVMSKSHRYSRGIASNIILVQK